MKTDYTIENLSFTYKGEEKQALKNINGKIIEESITLFLGPSGGGKTTFISILMNIIPEYYPGDINGTILHGKTNILSLPLNQMSKIIGLVFQNPESQFCTYTVEDEIAFGLENLNTDRNFISNKIDEVLKILNIEELKNKPLHKLSGGEKQKVAIASVLACDPDMIIFDEPSANLDPLSKKELFLVIKKLRDDYKKTILIIEHNVEGIFAEVDYLFLLGSNGTLLFDGEFSDGIDFILQHSLDNIYLPEYLNFYTKLTNPPKEKFSNEKDVAFFLQNKKSPLLSETTSEAKDIILKAHNVSCYYDNVQVLNNISLNIEQGDFIAIVGENGAGKTTLLNTLMDIGDSIEGSIELFGKNIKKLRQKKWKDVGYIFQNPEWQFVSNTVEQELLFSLKNTSFTTAEKNLIVTNVLESTNLLTKKNKNPFSLSQGEKRRLSVASVLINQKKLILLDEPTFGQDKSSCTELMESMKRLNEENTTLIMISHDMDLVYQYCNKVILIQDKKCGFFGSTNDFFENEKLIESNKLELPFWYKISKLLDMTIPVRSGDDAIERFSI